MLDAEDKMFFLLFEGLLSFVVPTTTTLSELLLYRFDRI